MAAIVYLSIYTKVLMISSPAVVGLCEYMCDRKFSFGKETIQDMKQQSILKLCTVVWILTCSGGVVGPAQKGDAKGHL